MGKTDENAEAHRQQSMVLIPIDTEGVEINRNISILNHHAPEGHCEVVLRNVRVPAGNLLGEEGDGFKLSQARLGPGRIHHCMRSIGQTELALELMCQRSQERKTFGKFLHERDNIGDLIAQSRIEIEQARLLVLKTAWLIDTVGAKEARKEISMIKVIVPQMQTRITDNAMQVFGAMGLCPDTPLASLYTWGRALRYADGPDAVHLRSIARLELKENKEHLCKGSMYMNIPRKE
jgi:acyl-CoA dehydrogenase